MAMSDTPAAIERASSGLCNRTVTDLRPELGQPSVSSRIFWLGFIYSQGRLPPVAKNGHFDPIQAGCDELRN
jgi:hypothetical protein